MFDDLIREHNSRNPIIKNRKRRIEAAILIPIIDKPGGPHLLFESRAKNLKLQPGETCFPGGGIHYGETPQKAAIRETCEELLIDKSQIELLCPLDGRQGPKMKIVWAYLGRLKNYTGTFSADEVDHVFTVPLSFFLENEPKMYKMKNICEAPKDFPEALLQNKVYRWELKDFVIPVYEYSGEYIWGFTARNIIALVDELKAI